MKRILPLAPQACLSLVILGVAFIATMLTMNSHALPAAPDVATTNTDADLGTLLTPGVTIGDPHNTATLNASAHLLAREGEDAEKYTIAETVKLINEYAALLTSEVPPFVDGNSVLRSIVPDGVPGIASLHRKEAAETTKDSVLSAKDGETAVLEARKPKWKRILEQIALCCECAACLYQNTQGADCRALCHDCKKPPH